jgi:hypothetical protein
VVHDNVKIHAWVRRLLRSLESSDAVPAIASVTVTDT